MEDDVFELIDVSFSYKRSIKKAVYNVSLKIKKGYIWGIIGPNGSGKTTLLDLLAGFKKKDSGKIIFNKKEIEKYKKKELSQMLSYVPQNFFTNMPFKVKEIVFMGRYPFISRFSSPSRYDLKLVEEAISLLELDGLEERYITELSGGERQRVVLAQMLAQNTPVMLLDEPTSNMDINHALKAMDIIEEMVRKKGKTAIIAIHDINLASLYCDRLIVLKNGKVICYGSICNVLNKELLKKVFGVSCEIQDFFGKKQVIFKKHSYNISHHSYM